MCKGVEDFVHNVDYKNPESAALYPDTFFTHFGLTFIEPKEVAIIVTYFAFTSLSTVGFGDFYPRSNFERCIGAMILLSGVAVFSYIMGNFIEILNDFKAFNSDYCEGAKLSQFFGILMYFNDNKEID